MIRSTSRLRLCGCLLVLNLAFIWGNSLLPAEASQAFSDWVKGLLLCAAPTDTPVFQGSGILRKIAHFTEFMTLGLTLGWGLGMLQKKSFWGIPLGCFAAVIDETIQIFIPGRGPRLADVLLDTAGAAAGIFLLTLGHALFQRTKQHYLTGGNTK